MKYFLCRIARFGLLIAPFVLFPFYTCFFVENEWAHNTMMEEQNKKMEYLEKTASPRIIFIGGSGCSHGINSTEVESALTVPVVNMGVHAGMGLAYQLQAISAYVNPGDFVIIVPEYGNFSDCLGGKDLLMVLSDIRPQDRKLLNVRQWSKLVKFMPEYGIKKIKYMVKSLFKQCPVKRDRDYGFYKYDEHGDMIASREDDRNLGFKPYGKYNVSQLKPVWENECIKRINEFIEEHPKTRIEILPPAVEDRTYDNQEDFILAVEDMLDDNGTPFAVKPSRYKMASSVCWDTPYHLNGNGIKRRTRLLIDDISRMMKKTK